MKSKLNMKLNKRSILIISIIVLIILGIKAFSYARLIIPQLFKDNNNDYSEYITEPVPLSEDSEVMKVLEKAAGLNAQELYDLANKMNEAQKYKEAYHLYKLTAEKDNDKALAYAEMANSYARVLNFEKAIEIAEEALTMINESTPSEEQYFAYYTVATLYYYREVYWGFADSERTIALLEKALTIEVKNPEYKEFCETRNLQMYAFLVDIYSYSPETYKPEVAICYLEKLYDLHPENIGLKLDMALLFLETNGLERAKSLVNEYKKERSNNMNTLTVECLYYLKTNEYKKAKKILNQLRVSSINERYRINYYSLSSIYYESIGDIDKAMQYYSKTIDLKKLNVFIYSTIQTEERLGLNFDDIREEIRLQNEEYNKISLELEQPISD